MPASSGCLVLIYPSHPSSLRRTHRIGRLCDVHPSPWKKHREEDPPLNRRSLEGSRELMAIIFLPVPYRSYQSSLNYKSSRVEPLPNNLHARSSNEFSTASFESRERVVIA